VSLFQQVTVKPWMPVTGRVERLYSGRSFFAPQKTIALRFFFAVVTILFSLLTVSYAERMAFEVRRPLPETWLLWSNAATLIFSGIAFQWATVSARRQRLSELRRGLYVGGFFTFVFLAGQLLSWHQLQAVNTIDHRNPANAFFYMITGLHGLHLLGGLAVWGRTLGKLRQGFSPGVVPGTGSGADLTRITRSVELCTAYWHFLLIVWLALFGLLFFPGGSLPIICRAF